MNTDKHRLTTVLVAAIAVLILMTGQALAQPCGGYEVTAIIQTPVDCGFGFDITTGLGLNDDGAVVGYYWCSGWEHEEAFVWTAEEGFVTLERPQGVSSARAVDINDNGIICGTAAVSGVGTRGFVYGYEGEQFTVLDIPPGGNWSEALAINSKGVATGFWGNNLIGPWQAFIWENGEMIDIGPSIGGANNRAFAITDDGAITGRWEREDNGDRIAFLWDDGKVISVGPIPGGFTSTGNAINSRHQLAVGGNFNEDHPQGFISGGFLWGAGQWTDLGMLPGYDSMALTGLNDAGQIVGWSRDIQNGQHPDTGFIWQDGVMTNINDLLPSDSQLTVYRVKASNNAGQVTGSATNKDNDPVAFILTAIEPPTGDLDGDCEVGVKDLLILLGSWGPCEDCPPCPADLDGSGVVGVSDLLILLGNWG